MEEEGGGRVRTAARLKTETSACGHKKSEFKSQLRQLLGELIHAIQHFQNCYKCGFLPANKY